MTLNQCDSESLRLFITQAVQDVVFCGLIYPDDRLRSTLNMSSDQVWGVVEFMDERFLESTYSEGLSEVEYINMRELLDYHLEWDSTWNTFMYDLIYMAKNND